MGKVEGVGRYSRWVDHPLGTAACSTHPSSVTQLYPKCLTLVPFLRYLFIFRRVCVALAGREFALYTGCPEPRPLPPSAGTAALCHHLFAILNKVVNCNFLRLFCQKQLIFILLIFRW